MPYLGQTPPGLQPEIFAPYIVSTGMQEHRALSISPDGKSVYWSAVTENGRDGTIYSSQYRNGSWTSPTPLRLGGEFRDFHPILSFDGGKMFFFTRRPLHAKGVSLYSIWIADKKSEVWCNPRPLLAPVNTNDANGGASVARDGTLYFWSTRSGARGGCDIYRSNQKNGSYAQPENLGQAVNSDGSWTPARNLGEQINSPSADWFSSVSPDGKYLFYISGSNGNDDYFWVDAT